MNGLSNVLCKFRLEITKIGLKVRFPCSVVCAFKNDSREIQIEGEADLKGGEVNTSFVLQQTIKLPAIRDLSNTLSKQYSILVYLKSTCGKMPAGVVQLGLSLGGVGNRRHSSRIEKCPDKNAVIEYEIKIEKMEESPLKVGERAKKTEKSQLGVGSRYNLNLSKVSSPIKQRQIGNRSIYMPKQAVESTIGTRQTVNLGRVNSKKQLQNKSIVLEDYYLGEGNQIDKKYYFQKQVERTKLRTHLSDKNIRERREDEESEQQLIKLKKKVDELQSKLKEEVNRADNCQKLNKELNVQLRSVREKMEEEIFGYESALKRMEIRENGGKEQLKILTEKLYASQNEKQRGIFQRSKLVGQFDEREKEWRQGLMEKQRRWNQQKNVLSKRIQSRQHELQCLQRQLSDSRDQCSDLTQKNRQIHGILQQLQSQCEILRNSSNELMFELTKCQNQKQVLQDNLQSVGKYNDERRNFKRQLSEKEGQIEKLRERVSYMQGNYNRGKGSVQEIQKALKQKISYIRTVERDYGLAKKENKVLSVELGDKDNKIQGLMEELQMELKRGKQLEQKWEKLNDALEEEREHSSKRMGDMSDRVHTFEDEIDKLNQQVFSYSHQIASLQRQKQEIELILEEKDGVIRNLQSQLIQLNQVNQHYQLEKLELGEEKKEIHESFQNKLERSEVAYQELNKKMLKNSELFDNKMGKIEKELQAITDKNKILNSTLKQKQQVISKLQKKCLKAQTQIMKSSTSSDTADAVVSNLRKQIKLLKQQANALKLQIQDKQVINSSLRTTISQLQAQYLQLQTKYNNLNSDHKSLTKTNFSQDLQIVQNHISKKHLLLRKTTAQLQQPHTRKQAIAELYQQLQLRQREMDEMNERNNKKINLLNGSISSKNKEIAEMKDKLHEYELQLEGVKLNESDVSVKLRKVEREKKTLENEFKAKISNFQANLKAQYQLKHALQIEKHAFERDMRQQKQTSRRLARQLQGKQYQIQELTTKILQFQDVLKQRQGQIKKSKMQSAQLKQLIQALTAQVDYQGDNAVNVRFTKICSQLDSRENQAMKQKLRMFYGDYLVKLTTYQQLLKQLELHKNKLQSMGLQLQISHKQKDKALRESMQISLQLRNQNKNEQLLIMHNEKQQLVQRINELQKEIIELRSQKLVVRKEADQIKYMLQEALTNRERDNLSKIQTNRYIQEQQISLESAKRIIEDLSKLIINFEKEKKASIFVISPLKEGVRKVQDSLVSLLKNNTIASTKKKRQQGLAMLRATKSSENIVFTEI